MIIANNFDKSMNIDCQSYPTTLLYIISYYIKIFSVGVHEHGTVFVHFIQRCPKDFGGTFKFDLVIGAKKSAVHLCYRNIFTHFSDVFRQSVMWSLF